MTIPLADDEGTIGTQADMALRLRSTLPAGWFPVSPPAPAASVTPVLDGLLAGLGAAWSFCFGLLNITAAQTRIGTAFGIFLDMISIDFFGSQLSRRSGEADDGFRQRISTSLISRRGTRQDVSRAVAQVTSAAPAICEPMRGADCGGYGSLSRPDAGGGLGYNTPGLHYGSGGLPFQCLLNVAGQVAFALGEVSARQSPATFVDGTGLIRFVLPRVLRPLFEQDVCIGALLEPRAFNLIINSRFWHGFAQSVGADGPGATWLVDHATAGVYGSDPILRISGSSGTRAIGPSIDVACGGSVVCGSAWIFLVVGSNLTAVELVLSDLSPAGAAAYAPADMKRSGQWQQVSVSLQTRAAPGRNLRVGLLLSGSSNAGSTVLTQCWQAEPGSVATSYIPSAGTLGVREQDDVIRQDPAALPAAFVLSDVLDAVASTIPAATIAWTAVSPTYVAN